MVKEMSRRGAKTQRPNPKVELRGAQMGRLHENDISGMIAEIKSVETINPVHQKQLLTYLRLTDKKLGILVNFNEAKVKDGISRIVNNL